MSNEEDDGTWESVTDSEGQAGDGEGERRERVDTLLDVLSSHRRRYALYYLREREIADIDDLVRYLVEVSPDPSNPTEPDERVERIRTAVVHTDVPKLRAAGVIEHDPRTETIRYRQPPKRLRTLLRTCSELEDPPTRSE